MCAYFFRLFLFCVQNYDQRLQLFLSSGTTGGMPPELCYAPSRPRHSRSRIIRQVHRQHPPTFQMNAEPDIELRFNREVITRTLFAEDA